MADIVDIRDRRIMRLIHEDRALKAEWRDLFMEVLGNASDEVFEKIYFAAKPILEEWMAEREP